ncbi:MAG: MarR family transcriptional regulator [Bacteroidetes bacterium]|nr:MAG: MarR family transcriptional regulator [Bacteroidota bacterium]
MSLEEEIKQSKFESEQQKAMLNLMFTSGWIALLQSKFFKKYDISSQQYNVLRILRGQAKKPIMLCEIANRMLDKSSNATRLVEKLRLKDLIDRQLCKENRRQVDIRITDKGLELLAEIDIKMKTINNFMDQISEQESKTLNLILDKMRG